MRVCVGMSLAKMNYTAVTALLLSRFTFRLAERVRPLPCRGSAAALLYTCTLLHESVRAVTVVVVQMGGMEGVFAAEQSRITVSPRDGLWMHAIPRG
jgi:hypothetical protein